MKKLASVDNHKKVGYLIEGHVEDPDFPEEVCEIRRTYLRSVPCSDSPTGRKLVVDDDARSGSYEATIGYTHDDPGLVF